MKRYKRIVVLAQAINEILVFLPKLDRRLEQPIEERAAAILQELRQAFDVYGGEGEPVLKESLRAIKRARRTK